MRSMLVAIILMAGLFTPLSAADWTLPAANQGAWLPGTNVGVPGGIEQYLAGGVNDRAVTGTVINVTASPHFAATNINETTGSITSGTATLTVANASGFAAGNHIIIGMTAIHTLTVTGGATATTNLRLAIGRLGGQEIILVPVVSGDTATQVATKIRAASVARGRITTGGTGVDVTFTGPNAGAVYTSEVQDYYYNSGVTGTFAVTRAGSSYSHQISSVDGNVLTLSANAVASLTDAIVQHDAQPAVVSALAAASAGDVVYFPAGDYRFGTGFIYTGASYRANITIRGAGTGQTTWHVATPSQLVLWSSPGAADQDVQVLTGTKTKGTSIISVPSADGYSDDTIVVVSYENETNNARIEAGAAPVWSSQGFAKSRAVTHLVTAVNTVTDTITLAPPLVTDGTNLEVSIARRSGTSKTTGWGIEDFSVRFDEAAGNAFVFNVDMAKHCWFYNLYFENWSLDEFNGSPIKWTDSYGLEVRKCRFNALSDSSSDGAVQTGNSTSCLIVDNIFTGDWDQMIYDNGNAANNVIGYNYSDTKSIFHNTHPSLNLIEGNAAPSHHSDGYHGSSSHNTVYRNWYWDGNSIILNRFKRNYALAANILGQDGTTTGGVSWGNPNMGNGDANGFAGPTGLSDQVGQLDYQQNGGTPNTYTIQSGDVFAGDFWADWEITGTLTTRTSDTIGIFTVSHGNWVVGNVATAGGQLYPAVHWNNKASNMVAGTVTNVDGSLVTIQWLSGSLPDAGTAVQLYMGNAGWQERDLDVRVSATLVENYYSAAGGTGAIQNGTADTLPDSLAYTAKPDWFGNLAWPPFDPNAPTFDVTRIPAGYRYINGNENYLTGSEGTTTISGTITVTGTITLE